MVTRLLSKVPPAPEGTSGTLRGRGGAAARSPGDLPSGWPGGTCSGSVTSPEEHRTQPLLPSCPDSLWSDFHLSLRFPSGRTWRQKSRCAPCPQATGGRLTEAVHRGGHCPRGEEDHPTESAAVTGEAAVSRPPSAC